MQIEFQTTKKDYIDFYKFNLKHKLKKNPTPLIILLLVVLILGGGFPYEWRKLITSLFIVPTILIFFYIVRVSLAIYKLQRSKSTSESYFDKKTIDTTDEGLNIKYNSSGSTKILKWERIISAHKSDDAIYLLLSDKTVFLIPKRFFTVESEKEFFDLIENRFSKSEIWFKNELITIKNKPPYWMGYLCLIPLVGAFIGIALILNGIFKYNKNKKLILMGVGGVVFTVAIYTSLYFFSISEISRKQMVPIARMELNTLVKAVEFYKIQHGTYPDSLRQATKDDQMISINDPVQPDHNKNNKYYYKKAGIKYYLFSSGIDGIPNTADDIYPKMAISDTTKFGLILKK